MRVETIGNATLYLADCREVLPGLSGVDAVVIEAAQRQGDLLRDIQPAPKLVTGDLWGG